MRLPRFRSRVALTTLLAGALCSCLLIGRPAAAGQQATYRSGIDLVQVGVSVNDRQGQLVPGLTADDFEVFEDGKLQTVTYFSSGDAPGLELHLGLLLDVSGSMGPDIAFTRSASIRFLNAMDEAVDVTLVDFDTEVRAARFSPAEFPRLVERIRSQTPRGETAMFDAIGLYLDGAEEQGGRTVMLLYTDGGDTRSIMRLHELLELVRASDATIYPIGVLNSSPSRVRSEQISVLRQIAQAAGGQAFFPASVQQLDKVYEQVAAAIRGRYTVGYVSTNTKLDGRWRKVEIKVKRPDARDLRIQARRGYYAPLRRE